MFPDFSQTARLGFQSGAEMGQGQNPLGQFVRMMLADWQQKKAAQQEYGMKVSLIKEEARAKTEAEKSTIQEIIGKGGQQGGFQPTKFNYGGVTFENPEAQRRQQQQEQDVKPLAGDTAARYSGATQGLVNIGEIRGELDKISKDEKAMKDLIYRANLSIEASGAKPTFIPGLQAVYRREKEARAGDKGANLGNKFLTLAENLLRARTGATAPEPEVVREEARTMLNSFFESPKTWEGKLKNNELYLTGVTNEIRPLRKGKDVQSKQYIRTGTDTATGKRVGMLSDGTVEEIQ